jgi:hypothetical protein
MSDGQFESQKLPVAMKILSAYLMSSSALVLGGLVAGVAIILRESSGAQVVSLAVIISAAVLLAPYFLTQLIAGFFLLKRSRIAWKLVLVLTVLNIGLSLVFSGILLADYGTQPLPAPLLSLLLSVIVLYLLFKNKRFYRG